MLGYVKSVLLMVLLYIVQFILSPMLMPQWYNISDSSSVLYMFSVLVVRIVGACVGCNKTRYWVLGDIVYTILTMIYSHEGAYGIGYRGFTLDGVQASFYQNAVYIDVMILFIVILMMQVIVQIVAKVVLGMRRDSSLQEV